MDESKRTRYLKTLAALKLERSSFETHWSDIAAFIKPRRLRLTKQNVNKGDKRNANIIDSTATQASSVLRAGMMSGMTSPARPWFRFGTQDPELSKFGPAKEWLEQARSIVASALLRSNFYNQVPQLYGDGGDFATGAMGMMEDDKDIFRFTPFTLGEYYIANDHKLRVRTFYREFRMTVRALVPMFAKSKTDLSNFSQHVQNLWRSGDKDQWIDVCHVIEDNSEQDSRYLGGKYKPYTDCYFELGSSTDPDVFLRESGFDEFPILVARWEVAAGDVYGTDCPGMKALGDVKQLQQGEKMALSAIDKMVRPPMAAPASMRNSTISQLPGGISYFPDGTPEAMLRPLVDTSRFRVDLLEQKQAVVRDRINEVYFRNLFQIISNLDPKDVTATAINEMKEEKLLLLGPTYGQYDQDVLRPLIDRAFAMLYRAGKLPEAPPELEGHVLEVEYISAMAIALKAIGRQGVDVFTGYVTQLSAVVPAVLDKIDTDAMVDGYAEMTGIPPNMVVPDDKVAQIRQQKAEAVQQQQQMQMLQQGADTAKSLSQSSVDPSNALGALVSANNA
jgi:hypothetical protein